MSRRTDARWTAQGAFLDLVRRSPRFTARFNDAGRWRGQKIAAQLQPFLPDSGRMLDIGTGTGHLAEALAGPRRRVYGLDLQDLRFVPLALAIGDAARLPFASGVFDAALILTVLHHIPAHLHAHALEEALRVLRPGGRLVILEDTYRSSVERIATLALDSAMNLEFVGHPHANRRYDEWVRLVAAAGAADVVGREYTTWYGLARMRHAVIAGVKR